MGAKKLKLWLICSVASALGVVSGLSFESLVPPFDVVDYAIAFIGVFLVACIVEAMRQVRIRSASTLVPEDIWKGFARLSVYLVLFAGFFVLAAFLGNSEAVDDGVFFGAISSGLCAGTYLTAYLFRFGKKREID